MVSSERCMALILERFPEFDGEWQEHLKGWGGQERGICNDMSAFSRYVFDLIDREEVQDLPAIFKLAEELMAEGDDDVQTAVATCFLENLQNREATPELWVPLLGPRSRDYCKAWDQVTGVKTRGLWDGWPLKSQPGPTTTHRTGYDVSRFRRVLLFPLVRIVLWLLGAFVLNLLFSLPGLPILKWLHVPEPAKPIESLAALAALILLVRFVERRSLKDAGVGAHGIGPNTARGFAVGAAILSVSIGAMAVTGVYQVGSVAPAAVILAGGLWHYLWVGVFEEVAFRGVVFRILEDWLGSWGALGTSAVLFGAMHLANQNSSLFAALCIAAEAGILLGAAYMLTRDLWMAIGIHWAWNFFEGTVFGTRVSGGRGPLGLFHPVIQGPALLTGGSFGPEASLIALLVSTVAGVAMATIATRRGQVVAPSWKRAKNNVPSVPGTTAV